MQCISVVRQHLNCYDQFTEFEQPVSFADDAADASWIHIPHKFPQQRTEGRLCGHQLLHIRDANADGLLCWSILDEATDNRCMAFM